MSLAGRRLAGWLRPAWASHGHHAQFAAEVLRSDPSTMSAVSARLTVIEHAGHLANQEQPAAFNERVERFWKELP